MKIASDDEAQLVEADIIRWDNDNEHGNSLDAIAIFEDVEDTEKNWEQQRGLLVKNTNQLTKSIFLPFFYIFMYGLIFNFQFIFYIFYCLMSICYRLKAKGYRLKAKC